MNIGYNYSLSENYIEDPVTFDRTVHFMSVLAQSRKIKSNFKHSCTLTSVLVFVANFLISWRQLAYVILFAKLAAVCVQCKS